MLFELPYVSKLSVPFYFWGLGELLIFPLSSSVSESAGTEEGNRIHTEFYIKNLNSIQKVQKNLSYASEMANFVA